MAVGYRVATVRLQSGERLPLLLSSATGIPLWGPTLFLLTELRAVNRAAATLQQAARALMVAHQVFGHLGIDLEQRLSEGRLLELGELDALASLAGLTQEALDELSAASPRQPISRPKVLSLESMRMRAGEAKHPSQV